MILFTERSRHFRRGRGVWKSIYSNFVTQIHSSIRFSIFSNPLKYGSADEEIEYLNPVIIWSEKISLLNLWTKVQSWFSEYSLFLIDPTIPIPLEDIITFKENNGYYGEDYEIDEDKMFLDIIPKILEQYPIPKQIFLDTLLLKIRRFLLEYTDFQPQHFKTCCNLFLHYLYFGIVGGRISGINSGAYSTEILEQELDELLSYTPKSRTRIGWNSDQD